MNKIFISYCRDDIDKVNDLVGIVNDWDCQLYYDNKDIKFGDSLTKFMEQINNVDYVLILCSEKYKERADARTDGVGYETEIITSKIYNGVDKSKFIPIIMGKINNVYDVMPIYLGSSYACILNKKEDDYERQLIDLHNMICDSDEYYSNKQKSNTTQYNRKNSKDKQSLKNVDNFEDDCILIKGIILNEVTYPKNDGTRGSALYKIPIRLSSIPDSAWIDYFIQYFDHPVCSYSTMHRPGIASVIRDKIILNGTTIEELKNYHRDIVVSAVNKANEEYKRYRDLIKKSNEEKILAKKNHDKHVMDIASEIDF